MPRPPLLDGSVFGFDPLGIVTGCSPTAELATEEGRDEAEREPNRKESSVGFFRGRLQVGRCKKR